ncbi:unnamed protein product [Prunus armeniaca]
MVLRLRGKQDGEDNYLFQAVARLEVAGNVASDGGSLYQKFMSIQYEMLEVLSWENGRGH